MTHVRPRQLTSVSRLLTLTAALELGAGTVLIVAPAMILILLLGPAVDVTPAVGVARVMGAALIALGAACWWTRDEERTAAAKALVRAMLIYNVAVVALVLIGALGALGPLQWTAVLLHGILAIWCVRIAADITSRRAEIA